MQLCMHDLQTKWKTVNECWFMTEDHPILTGKWKTYLDYCLAIRRISGGTAKLPYSSPDVKYLYSYLGGYLKVVHQTRVETRVALHRRIFEAPTCVKTEQSPWPDSGCRLTSQTYEDLCRGWGCSVWTFIVASSIKNFTYVLAQFHIFPFFRWDIDKSICWELDIHSYSNAYRTLLQKQAYVVRGMTSRITRHIKERALLQQSIFNVLNFKHISSLISDSSRLSSSGKQRLDIGR